jgi:hypothetical protein
VPDLAAMVLVELPRGKVHLFSRQSIEITGKLKLNAGDPEDFLYAVQDATVRPAR